MRRFFSMLLVVALLAVAVLVWFTASLPETPAPLTAQADAIVVLTGGNGRVERGLNSLAEGSAPILMISGVGQHATLAHILAAHADGETRAKIKAAQPVIVLDYVADSTQSNAAETAAFVAKYQITSLRLVTAAYHMPRSLLEFKAVMPGVRIIADPVMPDGFHRYDWWRDETTRRLVLSECGKYIAALILRTLGQ